MKILIDTNILLWAAKGDTKLSKTAGQDILDANNLIYVSVASFWEIGIKHSIGKLELPYSPREFFRRELEEQGYHLLDIGLEAGTKQAELPYLESGHKDPFDRVLVAEAIVRGMPLLSGDMELDGYRAFGLELRR